MYARVDCTCPECAEPMTVRADADFLPVPSPDLATDRICDGIELNWVCPHCEHPFDATITAEIGDDPVPWVGELADGTAACIQVGPHNRSGPTVPVDVPLHDIEPVGHDRWFQ